MAVEDANLATDTSDVADMDDAIAQGTGTPATEASPAGSSAATDDNAEFDLLSVARDVVGKRGAKDAAASSAGNGETGDQAAAGADAAEIDEDNFDDVPFHQHPRFKQVVTQRNQAKARLAELEPEAARFREVATFIEDRALSMEEAVDGLEIMGLAKTNPVEAWKRLKPFVQSVLVAAGEILPDDLTQGVTEGRYTKEAAIEIARARAAVKSHEFASTFQTQRDQHRQQQAAVEAVRSAALNWETERARMDPNFAAKKQPIMEKIAYLHRQGDVPKTPEAVKAQLAKVYGQVNAQFKAVAPAPKPVAKTPIRPAPSNGTVANAVAPAPGGTMDIAQQVLARRANGAAAH